MKDLNDYRIEERDYLLKLLIGKDVEEGIVFETDFHSTKVKIKECVDLYRKVIARDKEINFPYNDENDLTDSYIFNLGFTAKMNSIGPFYVEFEKVFNKCASSDIYMTFKRNYSFDYRFEITQKNGVETLWIIARTITSKKELFNIIQKSIVEYKNIIERNQERLDVFNALASRLGPIYNYKLVKVRIN